MSNKNVLLTGITGFLGSHTAIRLLEKGYCVTGTLRDAGRADPIRKVIGQHTTHLDQLVIKEADLNDREVWFRLAEGMDYIQHIASPFPRTLPKDETKLLQEAKQGALNVLEAAAARHVKRVVMTSSTGAVLYGKTEAQLAGTFDETDWTDVNNLSDTTPYFRSKTLAERAAWDFMEKDESGLELTTVLPAAILGPVLEKDFGTSANMVIKMLDRSAPALPGIGFDIIDVRSVADLLILCMESDRSAGERYIASSGYLTFRDMALILKQQFPDRKIPTVQLPNFMVRLFSNIDPTLKPILVDLGVERKLDRSKAVKELQWQPLPAEEAVTSCAKSILDLGIVK
ncbi:MAG: NAD-dependent epimerase/dehydratase family protein [Saprospiraceae bacterium]|nr:NAD-dependent epimerase/dehydratase family protein [Lewinella sp.]